MSKTEIIEKTAIKIKAVPIMLFLASGDKLKWSAFLFFLGGGIKQIRTFF